jgi:subtilisin-like proprotein convertase family protein
MRNRPRAWFLVSLLLFGAAYWFWSYGEKVRLGRGAHGVRAEVAGRPVPGLGKMVEARNATGSKSYRLSNTRQSQAQLLRNQHGIILRNALIDTTRPLTLDIPASLRAQGAPGSYIVQSAGPMGRRFYDRLKEDGVGYVSYIPNNAALVQATPEQAQVMASDALFAAVLPYEPYYKLALNLLPAAVAQEPLPSEALNVTTFPGERDAALASLQALGAQLMGEESSPFGPTLTVLVTADKLAAVAQLPLAREIEAYAPRRLLNDLTRVTLGVATNTLYVTPNYLDLTGSNVTVNLNDSGVDGTHPDFLGSSGTVRLEGVTNDYEGHGTHVAGIIMGNGSKSATVSNAVPGSIIPGAGFQGKATNATVFSQALGLVIGTTIAAAFQEGGTYLSDAYLQTNASVELGKTNLISNNSWGYDGVSSYDMHAASFDQATRDAQPGVRGEQPLLFVFAAGDGGNGNDNGGGGTEGTVLSPATAKNVITVGAIDAARSITNQVTFDGVTTNAIFFPWTDNNDLVAWFSSCGNVGAGTEGLSGRFKPDVVAPGMFIISCRATNYVDPTIATEVTPYPFAGQVVLPGKVNNYTLPLVPANFPGDTEELIIEATPNSQSPVPFPSLLILGAEGGLPLGVLGTNTVPSAPDGITNFVVVNDNLDGAVWNFGVTTTNGQIQPVSYDLTFYLVETNDLGVSISNANGYYNVVSNLNKVLSPYYVYQYGTSMSAGAVSGMLALMQEFLQTKLGMISPSPALLKAMLINGSRSVNQQYDFNTQLVQLSGPNEQGWGLPNLPNSVPASLTNASLASMLLVNQSTNDALATGQWQSYTIRCSDPNATNFPLRFTLVWTDPPGDPAAGIALVNNLDLLVTAGTGTNAQMWLGNDFLGGQTFTTNNSGDAVDMINNVQNVFIDSTNAPFQFPLTVTVLGARVNVNAATTQTNRIAQDYALVIESDDPALTSGLTISSNAISEGPLTLLAPYAGLTNALGLPLLTWPLTGFLHGASNLVTVASNAVPLLDQRVGANEPNLYANGPLYSSTNTNGNPAQWHFFVFTNNQISATNDATNVAFATFLPPNLATQLEPRTNGADLDLYVSTNPGLTNLDPAVFAAMTSNDMSVGRGGTETVIYSNSIAGEVYYIGVKSEDQQGADFGFYAIAQQQEFNIQNPDGSITYNYAGPPVVIPDDQFGQQPAHVLAIAGKASVGRNIRKVTVTLTVDHGNAGDLYGVLQPDQAVQVVINNYSDLLTNVPNLYNDLNDGFPGVHTDGPGSLQNFMGQTIPPLWLLEESDNAAFQGGQVTGFSVTVSPQPLLGPISVNLAPGQVFFDYVVVPNDAIYLTNTVTLQTGSSGATLGLFMTNFNDVTQTDADGTNIIFAGGGGLETAGGYLLVGTNSPLPLSGGIWYYGIYNEGTTTVTFTNQIFFDYNLVPNLVQTYTNTTPLALTTDGTTNSTQICITRGQQVVDLSVGVRLADPNLDDLVLQLTSPQGSSIVLFENRGGLQANNLGLTITNTDSTNYVYTTFTEDPTLTDVPIKFGPPPYASNTTLPQIVVASNSFEDVAAGTYTNGQSVDGWFLETNQGFNEVSVVSDPGAAHSGSNFLALANGRLSQTFTTVPGASYEFRYYARSPGLTDWWPADNDVIDLVGTNKATTTNMAYDVGEVDRAFTFTNMDGFTNSWLWFNTNVGNFGTNDFTIDFWIKTTNGYEQAIWSKRSFCGAAIFWDVRIQAIGTIIFELDDITHYEPIGTSARINDGLFHHVTISRSGLTLALYVDGVLDNATTTTGIADIQNTAMLKAGIDTCDFVDATVPFVGDLDEMDLWDRALSPSEIHAIYAAGSAGKYSTNSLYPNFQLAFDGLSTNTVLIDNFDQTNWIAYTNSFIATSNQTTIELAGNPLGVLLDDLALVQLPFTSFNNFYLPEEPLTPFLGQNPQGCWTLSIWDARLDSALPVNGTLLGWTLQLTTSSTNVHLIILTNGVPYHQLATNGIVYFGVDVPATANYATNTLFKASGPMNLYFNQNALPTGSLPGDVTLVSLGAAGAGSDTLTTQGAPPPLVPGQRYFLGVQGTGPGPESFNLRVNFDVNANTNIIALTNHVALTTNIFTNGPMFYSFLVPTNAIMATFQLLDPTNGQANLYARQGLPVPGPLSFDYQSLNQGTNDQFIVVTTNSVPVPLPAANPEDVLPISPTTWYLSVYNAAGVSNVGYTILATYVTTNELIIRDLNTYPDFTYRDLKPAAPPGFPTNVLYSFTITNNIYSAVQFTVTNLSANGPLQLLVGKGAFPTPDDFYIGSFNAGTGNQFVSIGTNASLTTLSNIWYAAVPNVSTNNAAVRYSITAAPYVSPMPATPLFIGAYVASPSTGFTMYWSAVAGTTYQIEVSTNLASWTVATNITATSTTAAYTDSVPVLLQPSRFFRIVAP